MGQNDDVLRTHCLEEKIIAMIRTSPHLAELFSEVREAYMRRGTNGPD